MAETRDREAAATTAKRCFIFSWGLLSDVDERGREIVEHELRMGSIPNVSQLQPTSSAGLTEGIDSIAKVCFLDNFFTGREHLRSRNELDTLPPTRGCKSSLLGQMPYANLPFNIFKGRAATTVFWAEHCSSQSSVKAFEVNKT